LDLQSADLSSEIIDMEGEWEFFWNQLLSPEDVFPEDETCQLYQRKIVQSLTNLIK